MTTTDTNSLATVSQVLRHAAKLLKKEFGLTCILRNKRSTLILGSAALNIVIGEIYVDSESYKWMIDYYEDGTPTDIKNYITELLDIMNRHTVRLH